MSNLSSRCKNKNVSDRSSRKKNIFIMLSWKNSVIVEKQKYVWPAIAKSEKCLTCHCKNRNTFDLSLQKQKYVWPVIAKIEICLTCHCNNRNMFDLSSRKNRKMSKLSSLRNINITGLSLRKKRKNCLSYHRKRIEICLTCYWERTEMFDLLQGKNRNVWPVTEKEQKYPTCYGETILFTHYVVWL